MGISLSRTKVHPQITRKAAPPLLLTKNHHHEGHCRSFFYPFAQQNRIRWLRPDRGDAESRRIQPDQHGPRPHRRRKLGVPLLATPEDLGIRLLVLLPGRARTRRRRPAKRGRRPLPESSPRLLVRQDRRRV